MATSSQLNELTVLVAGTLTLIGTVSIVIWFAYLFQRKLFRQEAAYRRIEELLSEQELKSAYALMEGREHERKRIAGELHDNLGNLFITLRLYVDQVAAKVKAPEMLNLVSQMMSVAELTSQEIRRLSHDLNTNLLEQFGLRKSLEQLTEAINHAEKVKVKTRIELSDPPEGELSINLYRIIQEMLSNTLKHARANQVTIELTQMPSGDLSLVYKDDGRGFDPARLSGNGIGLENLRERVAQFKGELTVRAGPGQGAIFIVDIPGVYA
ncbi:MAG: ATP-binding protein [Catalinimonas sp.]